MFSYMGTKISLEGMRIGGVWVVQLVKRQPLAHVVIPAVGEWSPLLGSLLIREPVSREPASLSASPLPALLSLAISLK